MPVKIRCSECRKKISVDEAFAGSMCRCPYCKSIVRVPMSAAGGQARSDGRPAAPAGRPSRPGGSRPGAPGQAGTPFKNVEPAGQESGALETQPVDESALSEAELAAIPTANPVFFQGMVTIVLIVILIAMTGASIYLGILVLRPSDDNGGAYVSDYTPPAMAELPNPFLTGDGPTVCRSVVVEAPVTYVVEAGTSMGDLYLFARDAVRASVLSLRPADRFALVVATDPTVKVVGNGLHPGGAEGEQTIRQPSRASFDGGTVETGGAPDLLDAVRVALKLKPRTVVVLVSRKPLENPVELGNLLAEAGAKLVLVVFGQETAADKANYESAVQAAGGNSRLLLYDTLRVLQDHYDQRELAD